MQVAGVISVASTAIIRIPTTRTSTCTPAGGFDEIGRRRWSVDGQSVPVFNDKHLHWRWKDALHMYQTAKRMETPLMAGSSLPLVRAVPTTLPERDLEIEVHRGGRLWRRGSYAFHAMEMLQSLIERRRGGETGVKAVTSVSGDAVWQAERDGRWRRDLLEAALAASPLRAAGKLEEKLQPSAPFYLIEHRDGLQSCVAMANGVARQFTVALKLKGQDQPVATLFPIGGRTSLRTLRLPAAGHRGDDSHRQAVVSRRAEPCWSPACSAPPCTAWLRTANACRRPNSAFATRPAIGLSPITSN